MKIFRSWTFSWWEVAMLKLSLMSFGIALAVHFHDAFAPLIVWWWVLFAVPTAYFMGRYVREDVPDTEEE